MRITIKDVQNNLGITNTYDIVNAIRNENPNMKAYVPLAHAENVADVGAGIMINQTVQNEFITSLVDRISLVVIRAVSLTNPLAKFKKGNMPQGRTIEEIFTDITTSKKYDAHDAEETFMRREIPNVKTLFHERNRQDFYKQTIQDDSLKSAFTSWGNFGSFVSSIINAIYNSAEVEEYEYMKLLIDNYQSKGLFKVVPIEPVNTETNAKEFIKKMRATVTKMSLPTGSRDYNSLAVRTRTDVRDMHLLIDADLNAEVDVEVLSKAFNMDKASFLGNVTVIDGFASEGLEAVLIDKEWFMVYDNLLKMESVRNPQGLYWNYYYHVWQTLSVSRFANAVAFVSGEVPPVSQVIVDPTIASVRQGKTMKLNAFVRANDGQEHEVVWKVEGSTSSSSVGVGTSINDEGLLTIGDSQLGELKVTATVTVGEDDIVGESLVTVIPVD